MWYKKANCKNVVKNDYKNTHKIGWEKKERKKGLGQKERKKERKKGLGQKERKKERKKERLKKERKKERKKEWLRN